MKTTEIQEEPKFELLDFISTFAGILGLFSGFCFLCIMEIVEIFTKIAMILLRNEEPAVLTDKELKSKEGTVEPIELFKDEWEKMIICIQVYVNI